MVDKYMCISTQIALETNMYLVFLLMQFTIFQTVFQMVIIQKVIV
jgi:hypothetical protein